MEKKQIISARAFSKVAATTMLLFMAAVLLIGCGDSGSASTASSTSGSTSSSTSGNTTTPPAGQGQGQRISGTITQYDSSSSTLKVQGSDGKQYSFTLNNTRITKREQITQQALSSLLGSGSHIVSVTGQQGSNNTYTGQVITVADANAMGQGGPGGGQGNGTPPVGGNGQGNGTPPAGGNGQGNGTPPAGGGQPNGTPGAGGGQGGRGLVLKSAKIANSQLVGTDMSGKTVTVSLSSTTTFYSQTTGAASDLTSGQKVTVLAASSQGSTTTNALQVVVGEVPQQASN